MICPRCKKEIPSGQNQCIYCGAPLYSTKEPQNKTAPDINWGLIITFALSLALILLLLIFNPFKKLLNAPSNAASAAPSSEPSDNSSQSNQPVSSNAAIPEDALEIDGNYYYVYTGLNLSSRAAAEKFCNDRGGHLAVITSDDLNDRLYDLCLESGVNTAIFGYSDEKIEGNWEWVTDKQPSYTNWGVAEPNADADEEDCAIFSTSEANGKWKYLERLSKYNYLYDFRYSIQYCPNHSSGLGII